MGVGTMERDEGNFLSTEPRHRALLLYCRRTVCAVRWLVKLRGPCPRATRQRSIEFLLSGSALMGCRVSQRRSSSTGGRDPLEVGSCPPPLVEPCAIDKLRRGLAEARLKRPREGG